MFTYAATVNKIVDGDTVWLDVDLGFHISRRTIVRLARINAPEMSTPAGPTSKAELAKILPLGTKVVLTSREVDTYGRSIGEIQIGQLNVSDHMLQGFAAAYPPAKPA